MVERNPHGIVFIGGDRYDTWVDKQIVARIEVELATNQCSEGNLAVFDPRFTILDRYAIDGGVPQLLCRFYLGFGTDLGPPVFLGLLDRVERYDRESVFIVQDLGLKLKDELRTEYHNNIHDLALIEKLAKRHGLLFEGPKKPPALDKHKTMIQDSKNDWELCSERAREAGLNIYVRQETLFAKEPAQISAPVLTLEYRKEFGLLLHDFSLGYKLPENQQGRPKIVEHRARKHGGRRLTGKSDAHPRGHKPVEVRHDRSIHTKAYVSRAAQGHKDLQREPAFNCTVRSIPPLPKLRPDARDTIELIKVGKLFSGPYLCDRVRHTLTGSEFQTEYTLYRDIKK